MTQSIDKKIRNLEDNYLVMQQKQDKILNEIKCIQEEAITKDEMDLANERLVERVFTKVEKNFARKDKVYSLERTLKKFTGYMIGAIISIIVSVSIFIINHVISII